jgi:hypothetical protein
MNIRSWRVNTVNLKDEIYQFFYGERRPGIHRVSRPNYRLVEFSEIEELN